MSTDPVYRWHEGALLPVDGRDLEPWPILAADSWLVTDGATLALALHRQRFLSAIAMSGADVADKDPFWRAALAAVPRRGSWYPRVELRAGPNTPVLVLRVRAAPPIPASIVVATHPGTDPRRTPGMVGPDLQRLERARKAVAGRGAEEAILLSQDGYVAEGSGSALLWWRGTILCGPDDELERIDSVTARSALGLAVALGVETYAELVTPAELEGTELWALSARSGPRIVTEWVHGPALAELPGRLGAWRARLGALRQPM
jgi:branched-subunit amino acid aminotransferase/4-amino-4-deoxychorismate lyase